MFQLHGADVQLFINAMVPLLDGSRDKEAVADVLGQYSRQSVMAFLGLLEQHGLVEPVLDEPREERWRGQEAFFRKWTDRPEEPARRLREARVLIAGLEPWGVVAAAELAASGVGALHLLDDCRVVPDDLLATRIWTRRQLGRERGEAIVGVLAEASPWCQLTAGSLTLTDDRDLALENTSWDLIIASLAGDELLLLHSLARFAHSAQIPSLFGHLDGLDAVVGPVVIPGQTACWNCVRLRQLANADHLEAAHALQASLLFERPRPRPRTYLAPMAPLLGHLLALEAVQIVSHYTPSHLVGRLLVQNLVTLETTLHTVIRMPWCEICGGAVAGGAPPGGPVLADRGSAEGGSSTPLRLNDVASPNDLRELLAVWVDSRTGIIRHLAVETPQATEPELPVTSSAVLASYTEGAHYPSGPEIGSGKGLTAVEAMIGAVGEAIERYSASRYRKADLYRSALNDLNGEFLDPRQLCLYADSQYAQPNFPFARFDPNRPIEWIRGYWLDTGGAVWVPALLAYFDFRASPEERFCQVTSNGLAAGAGLEDAALRAVLEIVERDAFMITWRAERPGRRLLLDDTIEPGADEVVRQLSERGVEVELFLLDAGLSIPTVICLGVGDGKRWPGVTVALAAHVSLRTSARRAILEQGHVGPYLARLMLDGEHIIPAEPGDVRTLIDHALYYVPPDRVQALDFLRRGGDRPIPLVELAEPPDASLAVCVGRLHAGGMRVAIAEVTSPDVTVSPFRVVRALGPDIHPIDFGFGLRRLASSRLRRLLAGGQDLNRHPHPLA
jgi:ribosomal protein S12 methylthiotransferase accessory factor